jgi:hypothetical protein
LKKLWLISVASAALAAFACGPANAGWVLTDTNGGDGSLGTPTAPYTYEIVGADNDVGETLTTLTNTATSAGTVTFNWSYTTDDCCGSHWDPGGYILNGAETQLNPVLAAYADDGATYTGSFALALAPGDTYGFYIDSLDSVEGPGIIEFDTSNQVPEPSTWAIVIGGLLVAGFAMRRRKDWGSRLLKS